MLSRRVIGLVRSNRGRPVIHGDELELSPEAIARASERCAGTARPAEQIGSEDFSHLADPRTPLHFGHSSTSFSGSRWMWATISSRSCWIAWE
jgi:hypothetical protein